MGSRLPEREEAPCLEGQRHHIRWYFGIGALVSAGAAGRSNQRRRQLIWARRFDEASE
jgi:hypothetical protein